MNSDKKPTSPFSKEMKEFIEQKLEWISEQKKLPAEFPPNKRIYCNNCKNETKHTAKYHSCDYRLVSIGQSAYLLTIGNQFWMCAGCENFTFERYDIMETFRFDQHELEETDSDEIDSLEELFPNPDISSEYFPKRTKNDFIAKNFNQLPASLKYIYEETIKAFNNEIPILCAVGIRALVEGICSDQEIIGSNLEKKIDGLARIIPKNIVTNLHELRFMGNQAAHELNAPQKEELQLAIQICEDLLNYLYELDYKASYLSKIRNNKIVSDDDSLNSNIKVWC